MNTTSPEKVRRVAQRHDASGGSARERIVKAARDWLFRHGVEGLTTDRLARDAGVSKSSIYKHFSDQAALIEAVIGQEAALISMGVPGEPQDAPAFWAGLHEYGLNLLRLLNRPEVIQLDRLMHEQARAHPGLGFRFFSLTYGRSHAELEGMLAYAQTRSFVRSPVNPPVDAELLLSMWEGMALTQARLGMTEQPYPDAQAWVHTCLCRLFPHDVH